MHMDVLHAPHTPVKQQQLTMTSASSCCCCCAHDAIQCNAAPSSQNTALLLHRHVLHATNQRVICSSPCYMLHVIMILLGSGLNSSRQGRNIKHQLCSNAAHHDLCQQLLLLRP
jgi:hypothetical protein